MVHLLYIMVRNVNHNMNQNLNNMKSLTLHALDDQLAAEIKRVAKEQSTSMNELAKRVLAEALGIKVPSELPHRDAFARFCGCWAEEDAREFEERVSGTSQVDQEDWN